MDLTTIKHEQPGKCDPDVYKNGTYVFLTHTIRSWMVEAWVEEVAKTSGQKVDWHFVGGRAVVKALGDLDAVYTAINKQLPLLREMWLAELKESDYWSEEDNPRTSVGVFYVRSSEEEGVSRPAERGIPLVEGAW